MAKLQSKLLALLAGVAFTAGAAFAQDSGPLIDLLVKKGIVTDQEGEQLRADLYREKAEYEKKLAAVSDDIAELDGTVEESVPNEIPLKTQNPPEA